MFCFGYCSPSVNALLSALVINAVSQLTYCALLQLKLSLPLPLRVLYTYMHRNPAHTPAPTPQYCLSAHCLPSPKLQLFFEVLIGLIEEISYSHH